MIDNTNHPFSEVGNDQIIGEFDECLDSDERFQLLLEFGDSLPALDDEFKTDENLVQGCTSRVWLIAKTIRHERTVVEFQADSDSHIVRGLIALLIGFVNHGEPKDILTFDIEGAFSKLDLKQHLSRSRSNGFVSMIRRIRELAAAAVVHDQP